MKTTGITKILVAALLAGGTPAAAWAEEPAGGEAGRVTLPEEEIQGTLEKPDVFFVLPRARDRTDERVIRERLRREITRPLVKDWLEEGLLLE